MSGVNPEQPKVEQTGQAGQVENSSFSKAPLIIVQWLGRYVYQIVTFPLTVICKIWDIFSNSTKTN
jgi:hypothetical protein